MNEALKFLNLTEQDATMIPVGFVLFLVFVFIFKRAFVFPYLRLVEAREKATAGAEDSAASSLQEAARLEEHYRSSIGQVRASAVQRKLNQVAEAKTQADQILQEAKKETDALLKQKRSELSQKLSSSPELTRALSDADSLVGMALSKLQAPPRVMSWLFALMMLSLMPSLSYAAEAAHHEPSISDIALLWLNFVIFAVILAKVSRKPLKEFWSTRRNHIAAAVNSGKSKLKEAEKLLIEARAKVSSLASETSRIENTTAEEARKECQEIVDNAKQEAARLRARSQDIIAAEERAFTETLRSKVAEKVLQEVEAKLRREFTPEKDQAFRAAALAGVKELMQ